MVLERQALVAVVDWFALDMDGCFSPYRVVAEWRTERDAVVLRRGYAEVALRVVLSLGRARHGGHVGLRVAAYVSASADLYDRPGGVVAPWIRPCVSTRAAAAAGIIRVMQPRGPSLASLGANHRFHPFWVGIAL